MKKNLVPALLIFLIALTAFLKLQTDDELYYDLYGFREIPETADTTDGVITFTPDAHLKEGDIIAVISPIHVPKGGYELFVDHEQDRESLVLVKNGDTLLETFSLPAGETGTRFRFSSEKELYNLKVEFRYPGEGTVVLKHAVLYALRGFFYSDTILWALFLVCLVLFGAWASRHFQLQSLPLSRQLWIWGAAGFAVLINYPLFWEYMHYGGDITYHISRIEGVKNELLAGQLPVRLFSGAFGGRGLIDCLYPDLFLYFPALLRLLGASAPFAYKALQLFINLGSMGSAYFCARTLGIRRKGAILAMVLYACLPYRLSVMYFRDALGEALAMVFLPLVIAGLYEILIGSGERWWILTLGMTGVIESHVLSALMAVILVIIASVLFFSRRGLSRVLLSGLWAGILNLWFIVPFLYYHAADIDLAGKFSAANFPENAVFPAQLFMSFAGLGEHSSNVLSKGIAGEDNLSLGLAGLLCLGFALFRLWAEKKREKAFRFSAFLTLLGAVLVWMSGTWFPWSTLLKFSFLEKGIRLFQFPLRFLQAGEVCLLFAGVSALFASECLGHYVRRLSWAAALIGIFTGIFLMDSFLTGTEHIANRFRAGIDSHFFTDYVPVGYDENALPEGYLSDLEIMDLVSDGLLTTFTVTSEKEGFIDLAKTCYPGYRISTEGQVGTELSYSKAEGGMMHIALPAGDYTVSVLYAPPAFFFASFLCSLAGAVVFLFFLISRKAGWNLLPKPREKKP